MTALGIQGNFSFQESNKYWDFNNRYIVTHLPEYGSWHNHLPMEGINIHGAIVRGFKRGSKQLGCPTANIEMTAANKTLTTHLVPGVYSAIGRFINPTRDFLKADESK
jgi:Riboflavin kinase